MKKRGKVLRDASVGPGLLIAGGQQYPYALEGIWKSEVPPRPGLVVDVEIDANEQVTSIVAVPESQLAKEQAELALAAAKARGGQLFGQLVAKVGMPSLVAGALLVIGWFFLATVSIQMPFLGKLQYTFYQILGFLGSNNMLEAMDRNGHPSAGFYGFLALLALAGPFVQYFWKDKRACLGGLAPLLFMIFVGLMVRSNIGGAFGNGEDAGELGKQLQEEAMKAISIGMGAYTSLLVSLYFAGVGTMKFLAAKGGAEPVEEKIHKAAA